MIVMSASTPQKILKFWFDETLPSQRFGKTDAFDALIRERFGPTLESAARGELDAWRKTLEGRLAEVIVLDQFSRNLYRGAAKAFAQDAMALVLSQEAVIDQAHKKLPAVQRQFLYMPFMHSESLAIHQVAMDLYSSGGMEGTGLEYEKMHLKIIERFGRYPHRNIILGRESTAEEIKFLNEPNSSF